MKYKLLPSKHGRPRKFTKKDGRDGKWWGRTRARKMLKLLAYYWHTRVFCRMDGELAACLIRWFERDTRERMQKFLNRYKKYDLLKRRWIEERLTRIDARPKEYKSDEEWFGKAIQKRVELMYREYPGNGKEGKFSGRSREHPERSDVLKPLLDEALTLFKSLMSKKQKKEVA